MKIRKDLNSILKSIYNEKSVVTGSGEEVLMRKIANSCTSFEEFADCVFSNEIPAVKLSPEESEMIRGGILPVIGFLINAYAAFNTGYSIGTNLFGGFGTKLGGAIYDYTHSYE